MGVTARLDRRRVATVAAEEIEEFSQQSASTPTPTNCLTLPSSQHQVDQLRPVALAGCCRLSESLQKLSDRQDTVEDDDNFTDLTQAAPMSVATYARHWSRFLNRSSTCPMVKQAGRALVTDPAILQQPTSPGPCDNQESKPILSALLVDTQPGICLHSPQPAPGHRATPAISSPLQAELEALDAATSTLGSAGNVTLMSSSDDVSLAQPWPPRGDDVERCPSSSGSSIKGTVEVDPSDVVEAASLIFIHEVVRRAVCYGGPTVGVEVLRKALCESWDLDSQDAYRPVSKVSVCEERQALLASHLEAKCSRKRSCSQSDSISAAKRRPNE